MEFIDLWKAITTTSINQGAWPDSGQIWCHQNGISDAEAQTTFLQNVSSGKNSCIQYYSQASSAKEILKILYLQSLASQYLVFYMVFFLNFLFYITCKVTARKQKWAHRLFLVSSTL